MVQKRKQSRVREVGNFEEGNIDKGLPIMFMV